MLLEEILRENGIQVLHCITPNCQNIVTHKAMTWGEKHNTTFGKCEKCAREECNERLNVRLLVKAQVERNLEERTIELVHKNLQIEESEVPFTVVSSILGCLSDYLIKKELMGKGFLEYRKVRGRFAITKKSMKSLLAQLKEGVEILKVSPSTRRLLIMNLTAIEERASAGALE